MALATPANLMSGQTIAIGFERVTKVFDGGGYKALDQIDLSVGETRFVSVVGPSGCGKSTLLNLAAGLDHPSEGIVTVHGEPLRGRNAARLICSSKTPCCPGRLCLRTWPWD